MVDAGSVSSVNHNKMVGERIKEARAALGLTQKELCALIDMPLPTLRDQELCKRIPGGDALAAYMHAGISANWLLTSQGPMLLADLVPTAVKPNAPVINVDALVQAVCVSVQTAPKGETLAQSARKAVTFYQYCVDRGMITPEGEGEGDLSEAL